MVHSLSTPHCDSLHVDIICKISCCQNVIFSTSTLFPKEIYEQTQGPVHRKTEKCRPSPLKSSTLFSNGEKRRIPSQWPWSSSVQRLSRGVRRYCVRTVQALLLSPFSQSCSKHANALQSWPSVGAHGSPGGHFTRRASRRGEFCFFFGLAKNTRAFYGHKMELGMGL